MRLVNVRKAPTVVSDSNEWIFRGGLCVLLVRGRVKNLEVRYWMLTGIWMVRVVDVVSEHLWLLSINILKAKFGVIIYSLAHIDWCATLWLDDDERSTEAPHGHSTAI
jgi:hypothetical protein